MISGGSKGEGVGVHPERIRCRATVLIRLYEAIISGICLRADLFVIKEDIRLMDRREAIVKVRRVKG